MVILPVPIPAALEYTIHALHHWATGVLHTGQLAALGSFKLPVMTEYTKIVRNYIGWEDQANDYLLPCTDAFDRNTEWKN